jgi:two-component system NtrC family sensor kinase
MGRERVLIVDDSIELCRFLSKDILPQFGYDTLTAMNGERGLRLISEQQPDLVLLDVQLPDISGMDVLREMQQRQLALPVILMTAHGSESIAIEAFRLGAKDYLIKPFDIDIALDAIDRVLGRARLQREKERLSQELEETRSDLEQRVKELTVLFGVSKSVTSLLDLDKVLERVVEAAVFIAKAEEGALWLLEPTTGELLLRAEKGLDQQRAQLRRLKAQDSMVGQVFRASRPIRMVSGVGEDGMKIKTNYLALALLSVPLLAKSQPIGVLSVANRTQNRPFTANNEAMLQTLADYAAIAITNARLYREIHAFSQELEEKVRERTLELRNSVSTVYHELNNPITAIGGYAALLLDTKAGPLNTEQTRFLGRIRSNVERLVRLVDDLSDVSKIEDGRLTLEPKPLNLKQVVEETINSLSSLITEKGLQVDITLAPDSSPVMGDPQRVAQILTNLVSNACRYTPAGGQIIITSSQGNGTAELTVRDSGIGIRPNELDRIFERFYRSDDPLVQDQPGTGLGLAITKSLVELHGGELWVKSVVGKGSTFGFTLPLAHHGASVPLEAASGR